MKLTIKTGEEIKSTERYTGGAILNLEDFIKVIGYPAFFKLKIKLNITFTILKYLKIFLKLLLFLLLKKAIC